MSYLKFLTRTRVTMLLTAKAADIVAGTWSGTLSDHRMAATFRVDADGTATVTSAHVLLVYPNGSLDSRDLTADERVQAERALAYMWAQVADRARALRVAALRAKADELEAEGDPEDANKIARLRAAA